MPNQKTIVLATFADRRDEVPTLMRVRSLRALDGPYADLPVWICAPEQQPLAGPRPADLRPGQPLLQDRPAHRDTRRGRKTRCPCPTSRPTRLYLWIFSH